MWKGKTFIQGTAEEAARLAVIQLFGVFLGGYSAMVLEQWGRSLSHEEQKWEQVTAAPSPIRCCREGSGEHSEGLQALLWGPLFRCCLWSCHLGYTRGTSEGHWPPAALRRADSILM